MADKLTLEYQVTSTYRVTLTADEIREAFGLGGTATESLVNRLLALHAYDATVLAAIHGQGEHESDNRYELRALNGSRLGTDGAQWVELSDEPDLEVAKCGWCLKQIAREPAGAGQLAGPWFLSDPYGGIRPPPRGAMVPCPGRDYPPMPHEPQEVVHADHR